MISLTLPLPPSVNGLYANVPKAGRVKTARYKAWLAEAGWEVKRQILTPPMILGPVRVCIRVSGSGKRGDLDGRIKAVLDLLTVQRIWRDDRQVEELHTRFADIEGAEVTIEELPVERAAE